MKASHCVIVAFLLLTGTDIGAQQDAPRARAAVHTIRPGDTLMVRVWREKELSADVKVSTTGEISLPLVGPLAVEGLKIDEAARAIEKALQEYLRNPQVAVSFAAQVSTKQ